MGGILDSMVAVAYWGILFCNSFSLRKGRLRTSSSTYKSRKFGNPRRCGNGTSALGVLYPHVTEQSDALLRIIYHGVGWLRCLSLDEAMREPVRGISEK